MTRICSIIDITPPNIEDLKSLRSNLDYEFKSSDFELTDLVEVALIEECISKIDEFSIPSIPKIKPKKSEFH